MDEHPLAIASHSDRDRLHRRPTVGSSVAGHPVIQVAAPQAARAVVAVIGALGLKRHV